MFRNIVLSPIKKIRQRNYVKFFDSTSANVQVTGQDASNLIKEGLLNDKPFLTARLGYTELKCLTEYLLIKKNKNSYYRFRNYLAGLPYGTTFSDAAKHDMKALSGFFPTTDNNMNLFSQLMLKDLHKVDVLGSWLQQEKFVYPYFKEHTRIGLEDLPPFNFDEPWSEALKGKKVLVIHPFASTIHNQYNNRKFLFTNPKVLPEFELKTFKAVQTIADNNSEFDSWFSALNHMKRIVDKIDYEIAIVGCGAYGLPLAAHIKSTGKKAIHLGGVTQCLFGIIGRRWETVYDYKERFFNEYWVRPDAEDIPKNAKIVEGGCYW